MTLLLDIGNSRLKWALARGREFVGHGAAAHGGDRIEPALGDQLAALPRPDQVWVSNVAGSAMAEIVSRLCADLWSLTPEFAAVQRDRFGLTTGYGDLARLGVDRWLGLLAAWDSQHRPLCVAACGTALTVDLADAGGRHLGGYIVPGPDLMQDSLMANTDGIRERGSTPPTAAPGLSTSSCVNNGCGMAAAAFIDRCGKAARERFGDTTFCVMTGGAADLIQPLLVEDFKLDPLLVLRGLALIAAGART
jgi:type III pantothenate kinase